MNILLYVAYCPYVSSMHIAQTCLGHLLHNSGPGARLIQRCNYHCGCVPLRGVRIGSVSEQLGNCGVLVLHRAASCPHSQRPTPHTTQ